MTHLAKLFVEPVILLALISKCKSIKYKMHSIEYKVQNHKHI